MTTPYDRVAVLSLQQYIESNVPELNKVYDEFPYHGDEMVLPCCSIATVGTPLYTNLMPYVWKREADPENALNDIVYEVIGMFDARLQVDVWTEYKHQRGTIIELIDKAFNKQYFEEDLPQGLSLVLTDYNNAIARYDQVGYTYMDNEESTNRSEWRVKLDVLVNYPKIAVKSAPRINEIVIINQISDNNNVNDDDASIEEDYDVQI